MDFEQTREWGCCEVVMVARKSVGPAMAGAYTGARLVGIDQGLGLLVGLVGALPMLCTHVIRSFPR